MIYKRSQNLKKVINYQKVKYKKKLTNCYFHTKLFEYCEILHAWYLLENFSTGNYRLFPAMKSLIEYNIDINIIFSFIKLSW